MTARLKLKDQELPPYLQDISLLWLRDACQCPQCVDPHSGQKNFSTVDLPKVPYVTSANLNDDGSLSVVWGSGRAAHVSNYPESVIKPALQKGESRMIRRTLWDRSILEAQLDSCRISYDDWLAGGERFGNAFAQLNKTGLIFVHGVPESETSVEVLGRQIGHLQDTFYGLTWDVVSKPEAENVAYTNTYLGLHQDLLYYRDTPRIQLLHCISNECDGGESIFSDRIRAATQLYLRSRPRYNALQREYVRYHYNRNGHAYSRNLPVVSAFPQSSYINAVNWSPPFQGVFPAATNMSRWYDAAKAFEHILSSPRNMFEYKMRPGECVIFDNWRVLHGRRKFNTAQGKRWLKGTYVSDQVFRGRAFRLMEKFEGPWEGRSWQGEVAYERKQLKSEISQMRKGFRQINVEEAGAEEATSEQINAEEAGAEQATSEHTTSSS